MRSRLVLACFSLSAAFGFVKYPASPRGAWTGTYVSSESGGQLWLQIDSASSGWTARLKVTSAYTEKPEFRECTDVRVAGDSVSFAVYWGTAVHWSGTLGGSAASGTISTEHWSGSWKASRDTTGRNK